MHCMAAVSSDTALEDVEPSTNVNAMASSDRMIILSFDVIDFIILPH
tara:strand:- start:1748 stop:1888 length:141 start_codon:yes stop_codon:yes gene_type:complete